MLSKKVTEIKRIWALLLLVAAIAAGGFMPVALAQTPAHSEEAGAKKGAPLKKVLFIGDSMTGWLAERLNAYGRDNGFEVATVVWDGSTIRKWATSPRLQKLIDEQAPDAVFVSLGMNELFERNPERNLKSYVEKIVKAVGDRRLIWVGPPSWPGHDGGAVLDGWLAGEIGSDNYFSSLGLDLERQSARNPHPSRKGIIKWVDAIADWLPESALEIAPLKEPTAPQMVRGKTFIYKRMKETL